jgi:phospholipase C
LAALLALQACASLGSTPGSASHGVAAAARAERARAASSPIQHVVFIIQENRSFDNLFQGYPKANTVASGLDSKGETVQLVPVPLEATYDVEHFAADFISASDGGKMDGFDKEEVTGKPGSLTHPQYGYVPHSETKLYFEMAKQYVLGDDFFPSNLDSSWVAHQYAIAAQAHGAVDLPTYYEGCDKNRSNRIATWTKARQYGPYEQACQNYTTLGDELDAAGLSWRYYTYATEDWLWSAYGAVRHIRYGPDWQSDVVSPETQVLDDVAAGTLANITWVTPSVADSDHSSSESNTGPDWVANVVNAVGTSPFWNSTAIFVIWDEWGGWYDHVPPPYADYDGLGIRAPLLVISPYAKRDYVSHQQYETASVLRFAEDVFGLSTLSAADARANDPAADCFDFSQQPRPFVPFKTRHGKRDFERADRAHPGRPDDD